MSQMNNFEGYFIAPLVKVSNETDIGRVFKRIINAVESYQDQNDLVEGDINFEEDNNLGEENGPDEDNIDLNEDDESSIDNSFHSDSSYQNIVTNKLIMLLRKIYTPNFTNSFFSINFPPNNPRLFETTTEIDFDNYENPFKVFFGYKVIKRKDTLDNLSDLDSLFKILNCMLVDTRMLDKIEKFIDYLNFYPVYGMSMTEHLSKSDQNECRLVHRSRLNNFCPIKFDSIEKEKMLTRCCKNVFESSEIVKYLIQNGKCPLCRSTDNVLLKL